MSDPIYNGFRFPDGSIPPGLRGNQVQRENDWLNESVYLMYLWRLFDIAISGFKWYNLPEGINPRQIEWWLLRNGMCVFLHDEGIKEDPKQRSPEGYAVMQVMLNGNFDIYNIPERRTAYSVDPQHNSIPCDITNSVICFNTNTRTPTWLTLDVYAKLLAQCERTIYVNVSQQKTPRIVKCTEQQRLSMQNLFAQVDGFMPTVWADKNLDLTGVEVLESAGPFIATDLQVVKHQLWNEALTFLGIENANTDKKERLVSDEVLNNMGDVEAQRFTRLEPRQLFCEEVNRMFGLDIWCEFNTGLYIKSDTKNESDIVGGYEEENTGSDEGASLWTRVKSALKGGK